MHIHITYAAISCFVDALSDYALIVSSGPDENQVARAKALTEDLLEVVRSEHAKAKAILQQQQMELHQAQQAYAAYSASYGVRTTFCIFFR
jgi:hypothetical protein